MALLTKADLAVIAQNLSELRDAQVPAPAPGTSVGLGDVVMPVGAALAVAVGRTKFTNVTPDVLAVNDGYCIDLDVSPMVPDAIGKQPGTDGQNANDGQLVADAPAVIVTSQGRPVGEVAVVFSVAAASGSIVNGGTHQVVLTDTNGFAQVSGWRIAGKVGDINTLHAQVFGVLPTSFTANVV